MEIGGIKSIVAPLHRADFEPDLVLIYGNGAQIVRLVQGAFIMKAEPSNRNSWTLFLRSVYCQTLANPKCNVIVPGGGERVFALTADDEIAFVIPASQLQNVTEGLIGTHKAECANPYPVFWHQCPVGISASTRN